MSESIWVLHLCGRLSVGGVQTMLMEYYRNIDRHKVNFAFAVQRDFSYEYDDQIKRMGGRIHFLPDMLKNKREYAKALSKLLEEHREYKIVHCHFNQRNWIMLRVAKDSGVPIRISHAHAAHKIEKIHTLILIKWYAWLIRRNATLLLSCSHASSRFLYGCDNAELIHNAINLDKFAYSIEKRVRVRRELRIDDETIALCQIGHINENKNQTFSIDILRNLDSKYELFIIGDGDEKKELIEKTKKFGLENRVHFLGIRSDVDELLCGFDLMLFPSKHEGLSVVCIEAQAAGIKSVISDNVPDEVIISDLVVQLPISNCKVWSDYIYSIKDFQHHNTEYYINKSGYNIKTEGKKLEDLYIRELEKYYENNNHHNKTAF